MRAIFIDAKNRRVEEFDFTGNFRDIQRKLGVELFTTVNLRGGDTLYVDDEGLLNGTQDFFLCGLYPTPLAGNGLILGSDDEGETVAAKLKVEELGYVHWLKLEDGKLKVQPNG